MYNVLIFGTGKTSRIVESALKKNINIVAYLDNDSSKWNKIINSKIVLPPRKIKEIEYDYIIIASQYNDAIYSQLIELGIDNNKIFQHNLFCMFYFNEIKHKLDYLIGDDIENVEILLTGISYMVRGIDINTFSKKAYSLALFSQDLFYDYSLIKYIIENYKAKLKRLKYVIIGLSYYSFEYDLSLSSLKYRTLLYNDAIGVLHNFIDVEKILVNKNITVDISKKIFDYDESHWLYMSNMVSEEKLYTLDKDKGKRQAEIDCNKNYPKTVEENIKIFDDYLELLKINNIKPIVVVPPVSKYYAENFSKRISDKFMSIISDRNGLFQYIDYFESDLFEDSDFFDVSHLNEKGAKKYTKIIDLAIR